MLLNAVGQMLETPTPSELRTRLTAVATGASIGLFTFEAAGQADAEAVRAAVRDHFRKNSLRDGSGRQVLPLGHGTFVVDTVPVGNSPDEAFNLVVAANRWRQMRQPTVSLDGLFNQSAKACYVDCVRPAANRTLPKDSTHPVSESVYQRHQYGRRARQQFYADETGRDDLTFTDEFNDIGTHGGFRDVQPPTNTADKLAVFYVDGNGFGEIGRRKLREGVAQYRAWSQGVRGHHCDILKKLLTVAEGDPTWRNGDALRLETLLWGGDEIVWVVPAWKGWELAKLFFRHEHVIEGEVVTYACGLVFCHTKAPIANVVKLAKRLGDAAKHAGKDTHRLAYEVLESFDDITSDFDEHRTNWLPKRPEADPAALIFDPTRLTGLLSAMRAIAGDADFPTRQLHRLCKVWRTPEKFDDPVAVEASALKRLRGSEGEAGSSFQAVEAAFDGRPVAWLHLLQMLPYLPAAVPA